MNAASQHRPMVTARTRTVRRAVEYLGGNEALAKALGVTLLDVADWVSDLSQPHDAAFFAALDIVAMGPIGIMRGMSRKQPSFAMSRPLA